MGQLMPQGKRITLYPGILEILTMQTKRFQLSQLTWPMEGSIPLDVTL